MKSKVLAVGNAELKLKMSVDMIPVAGHTAVGNKYERLPSGSAVLISSALCAYGNDVATLAKVGADSNGAKLRQFLESAGADTKYMASDRLAPTGLSSIICESDRTEREILFEGANPCLSVSDTEEAFNSFPDTVVACADAQREAVTATTVYASKEDTPVFLFAIGPYAGSLTPERLKHIKAVIIDSDNIRRYTGLTPGTVDASLKACIALAAKISADYYILRLGSRGIFLYDGKYYNVVTAVESSLADTTDTSAAFFTAALITMYNHSSDMRHACEYASCAECCCLARNSNALRYPTPEEVKNYIIENGFEERMSN